MVITDDTHSSGSGSGGGGAATNSSMKPVHWKWAAEEEDAHVSSTACLSSSDISVCRGEASRGRRGVWWWAWSAVGVACGGRGVCWVGTVREACGASVPCPSSYTPWQPFRAVSRQVKKSAGKRWQRTLEARRHAEQRVVVLRGALERFVDRAALQAVEENMVRRADPAEHLMVSRLV